MHWFPLVCVAGLVACGPSSDDEPAGPGDRNGDGIDCSALDEVHCGRAMSSGSEACAWVEIHRFADPHAGCVSTTRNACIEMNLSGAEGCLPTICPDGDRSVFVREADDGSFEVLTGPFCGNEPLEFWDCTEQTAAACSCFCSDSLPTDCESDPLGAACREAFTETCSSFMDELLCRGTPGLGDGAGTNLACTWLSPTRWTMDGETCTGVEASPRCVAGYYVGDGGVGCSQHFDPMDPGPGVLVASSAECLGPYEWAPCGAEDAPPECTCGP